MIQVLSLFEKLTNIKGYKSKKIKDGITNINYKVFTSSGEYVIRIPRKNMIGLNYHNQIKVLEKVKELNVEVVYFNEVTGILITKFINHKKRKEVPLDEALLQIKKLHSIKLIDIELFDPFIQMNIYKNHTSNIIFENEEKVIEKAKKVYEKHPIVLCHNDLLFANFLKTNERNYLIDYEYAGGNIALFDIVSFLSENNIDDTLKQREFLKSYYNHIDDELLDDVNTMYLLLDLLWGHWAFAMYHLYNEETFLQIALEKQRNYSIRICNF